MNGLLGGMDWRQRRSMLQEEMEDRRLNRKYAKKDQEYLDWRRRNEIERDPELWENQKRSMKRQDEIGDISLEDARFNASNREEEYALNRRLAKKNLKALDTSIKRNQSELDFYDDTTGIRKSILESQAKTASINAETDALTFEQLPKMLDKQVALIEENLKSAINKNKLTEEEIDQVRNSEVLKAASFTLNAIAGFPPDQKVEAYKNTLKKFNQAGMIDETVYNSFMSAIPKDPVDAILHVDEMRETLMGSTENQARSPLKPLTAAEIIQIKESYDALTPEEKELFPTLDDFIAYIQKTREESVLGRKRRGESKSYAEEWADVYTKSPDDAVDMFLEVLNGQTPEEQVETMRELQGNPKTVKMAKDIAERLRKINIPENDDKKSIFNHAENKTNAAYKW